MNFKFLKGYSYNLSYTPQIETFNNTEFCFQFGDEDPVVFATGPNLTITLNGNNDGNIVFEDRQGNIFKLFAREGQ
jgi:hypothetical protein